MFKKKSTSRYKTKLNSLVVITILSLAINVIAIIVLITGASFEKAGTFNNAIVNDGIATLCSSQYRQTVQNDSKNRGETDSQIKFDVALVDYPCSNNGAAQYYQDGFKQYQASLGLKS
ncbi:MAG: hypothetical protein JWO07_458 [Candidatus Saccharibacteria bacterium]|nr:hypothetical protein [Candidatus Saccharibacteria bacterium]